MLDVNRASQAIDVFRRIGALNTFPARVGLPGLGDIKLSFFHCKHPYLRATRVATKLSLVLVKKHKKAGTRPHNSASFGARCENKRFGLILPLDAAGIESGCCNAKILRNHRQPIQM